MTNFSDMVTTMGVPAIGSGIPITFGKYFFVDYDNGSDGNNGEDMEAPLKTLPAAYAKMTSGNDDVCLLRGASIHLLTAMLTVAKSRCHFVGLDTGGHLVQQGAKIKLGVTTAATDLAPILNTGVRNSFRNIKVENINTKDESLYGFIDNGEGTVIDHFQSISIGNPAVTGHAHFWLASDSSTIRNATFGQSNTPSTAAVYGMLIDGKTGGATDGTVKENVLENITINISVGGAVQATSCFIKIADTSALNFVNSINGLHCHNFTPVGGTILTDAILGVDNTVSGVLDISNAHFFGVTGVGAGASQGVYIASNSVAADANGGLATAVTD